MKPKTVIAVLLLAFVAVSVAFIVLNGPGEQQAPVAGTDATSETALTNVTSEATESESQRVLAYYFFGNVRCQTCKKIEAYTVESIANFTNELADGALEWRTANVDTAENEHFVKDYELTSRSVVLVRMVGDEQQEWKNLTQVWDLVGDKEAFEKYITDETRAFMTKGRE